ncbi:hypothetical protein BH11MYX4_BH11MYX4_50280 [soil metagenome]
MTSSARRPLHRALGPASAVLLAVATLRCGLLGAPGGYSGAGEDPGDAQPDASSLGDGPSTPDALVLPDGNVPGSIGTITLMAGERDPTSADDDPAWSADAWSGILDANGAVASWRIEKSAPLVGSFDSAALIGNKWVMINVGFGLNGARGTAIQQTSWIPGIAGDWKAGRANGAPGGLDETTRAFFGAHLGYVGGTRTVAVDGGTNTFFTNEVHVADVDTTANALGASSDTGVQLLHARSRAGVLLAGTSFFVAGGRAPVAGGITASVERSKVDLGAGTFEAFTDQPPMKDGAAEHKVFHPALVAADGYLWVSGGRTNGASAPTDVVLSSAIDPATGALGEFQSATKLPKPLHDHAFVAFKGRLYVAGGVTGMGRSDEVYSAAIGAGGTLGAWEPNAKLPGARSDFVALTY